LTQPNNIEEGAPLKYLILLPMTLIVVFGLIPQVQNPSPTFADIEPILEDRCIMCHSGERAPKKLQLTSYANVLKGSVNDAVVRPRDAQNSELIKRIKGISEPRMPLNGPPWLTDEEIALIEKWIEAGAPDARTDATPEAAKTETPQKKSEFVTFADAEPILGIRCMKCHNTKGLMGPAPEGYLLTNYENALDSRDRARIIPGNPNGSELIRRIRGQALPRMPHDGPPYLSNEEIELLENWIAQGARDRMGNAAHIPIGAKVRLHGTLSGLWELDGLSLGRNGGERIDKKPRLGDYVEVRGLVSNGGAILVERIRRR
jgi:uncharacterized membrane protein